ncbi:MAG TPA: hypothetical protein VFE62_07995 [Gemmataceae bacterium]|nr:hypothetical protein [Gemmataceae bacterium]
MQLAQVVTYGIDDVLAERLRERAQTRRFRLRETNQLAACRNLVQSSSVLVMVLGRDMERELELLEQVHAALPRTATIVIGESANPLLAGLTWDLGASFALFPPTPLERIGELLERILAEAA